MQALIHDLFVIQAVFPLLIVSKLLGQGLAVRQVQLALS